MEEKMSANETTVTRRNILRGGVLAGAATMAGATSIAAFAADEGSLMGNGEVYPVAFFNTSLSLWNMHFAGLEDVGKIFNITFQKFGPTGPDIAASVLALEQATALNPPGMIVGAIDDVIIGKSINKALDLGIPVVTMDAGSYSSRQLSYIGTSNESAGYECGKRLIEAVGGEGSLLVTTTTIAGPAKLDRLKGFKRALDETNGKVTIAGTVEDGDQAEKAVTAVGQGLQAYPDIKGVFTISAGAGLGTAQAMRQAGKTDIPTVAFGNDEASYRMTKEQNLTMVAQDGYKMGFMSGLLIHLAAKKLSTPRYNYTALGKSVLPPNVDTGFTFVDASNADSFLGCNAQC